MKARVIIYSLLILLGGLWIAAVADGRLINWFREGQRTPGRPAVTRNSGVPGTWARTLKTPWTNTKVILFRESGAMIQLDAKSAVYSVLYTSSPTNRHRPFDVPIIAFVDPSTGKAWAGWNATGDIETNEYETDDGKPAMDYVTETNLFFETDSGICNGRYAIEDGEFCWDESMIEAISPGKGLDAVIEQIETNADNAWPFKQVSGESYFGDCFPKDFFSSHNMGNQTVPIQRIEVGNGTLRLYIDSLYYKTTAAVWLDLKSFEVRRTIEYRPVHFNAETFYLAILPAATGLVAAAVSLRLAGKARNATQSGFTGCVIFCIIWSWILLYRIHILGAWPTHLPIMRPVIVFGDWAVYLPVVGIGVAVLMVIGQALVARIRKEK